MMKISANLVYSNTDVIFENSDSVLLQMFSAANAQDHQKFMQCFKALPAYQKERGSQTILNALKCMESHALEDLLKSFESDYLDTFIRFYMLPILKEALPGIQDEKLKTHLIKLLPSFSDQLKWLKTIKGNRFQYSLLTNWIRKTPTLESDWITLIDHLREINVDECWLILSETVALKGKLTLLDKLIEVLPDSVKPNSQALFKLIAEKLNQKKSNRMLNDIESYLDAHLEKRNSLYVDRDPFDPRLEEDMWQLRKFQVEDLQDEFNFDFPPEKLLSHVAKMTEADLTRQIILSAKRVRDKIIHRKIVSLASIK